MTTSTATLIDHIFVNTPHRVSNSAVLTLDMSDHLATHVTLLFSEKNNCQSKNNVNNSQFAKMSQENLEKFREKIDGADWSTINTHNTASEKFTAFTELYTNIYSGVFSNSDSNTSKSKQRRTTKPWNPPWLQDACDRKNKLYEEYVKRPTVQNKTKYTKAPHPRLETLL